MFHLLSGFWSFLGEVFGHWQTWLSGGGVGGFLALATAVFERLLGKNLSHRAWVSVFVLGFFVGSCFLTWLDQHDQVGKLTGHVNQYRADVQKVKDACAGRVTALTKDVAVKEGINQTLQNQNRSQQATINGILAQAIKMISPGPLKISSYYLGQVSTHLFPAAKQNWGTFLVLTNKTITPVKLLVTCEADIRAEGTVMGTNVALGGGWGGRVTQSPKQFGVGIPSPAWTPTNPLLVTVFTDASNVGTCMFDEQ